MTRNALLLPLLAAAVIAAAPLARAQSEAPPAADTSSAAAPAYKPPLRGAPGGRVGGASRSAVLHRTPLPTIELLAPSEQAGLTARPDPTLCFFISRPSRWPMQLTISAPMQPAPVLEVTIPSATAAGVYPLPTGRYGVRLQPGIAYTWSVSIVLDPNAWSHNIVASATLEYDPTLPTPPPAATPLQRISALAGAGLWYDAVAAAVDTENLDRHRALDALLQQVGLRNTLAYEQGAATE